MRRALYLSIGLPIVLADVPAEDEVGLFQRASTVSRREGCADDDEVGLLQRTASLDRREDPKEEEPFRADPLIWDKILAMGPLAPAEREDGLPPALCKDHERAHYLSFGTDPRLFPEAGCPMPDDELLMTPFSKMKLEPGQKHSCLLFPSCARAQEAGKLSIYSRGYGGPWCGKYPWGEQPFTMSSLPSCMIFSAIVIGVTLIGTGPDGTVTGFPSPKDLHGVVGVTLGWVCMWYAFLGNQITFKMADIDENQKTTAKFIADRGVGNTMEQCIPFFLVLWLHAFFVNPGTSSVLGLVYVISRYLYPIFYGWYGQFSNLVEISAQMNYSIIMWLFWAIVYKCMKDSDLHTDLTNIAVIFIPLVVFLAGATILVIFLFGSKPSSTVIANGVAWEAAYKPPLASQ